MTILEMETQIDVLANELRHYKLKCKALAKRNSELNAKVQQLRSTIEYERTMKEYKEPTPQIEPFTPIYA